MNNKPSAVVSTQKTDTYLLRWTGSCHWWAIFYVDTVHRALSIQSDFGDYSYRWGGSGECFKSFLSSIGNSYLLSKLGQGDGNYFYEKESIKKLRELVKTKCAEKRLSLADFDDAFEELESNDLNDANMFFLEIDGNSDLNDVLHDVDRHEIADCIVRGHTPQILGFVEKIWPSFVSHLKEELSAKTSQD